MSVLGGRGRVRFLGFLSAIAWLGGASDAWADDVVPSAVVSSFVNVRNGPSAATPIVGRLLPGSRATLLGDAARWYHVELPNYYKEIHMAILKLRSITCLQQAETFTDELYVTFNGTKRSLPNMTQGRTEDLSDEFLFEGSRELSLFENDGDHWYDRDDFIAKHTITISPADLTLDFEATSGNAEPAHYALSVSITPGP